MNCPKKIAKFIKFGILNGRSPFSKVASVTVEAKVNHSAQFIYN